MQNTKPKTPAGIEYIRELLKQNRPLDALKYIDHIGQQTPVINNARGVCLMRVGKINEAISILRELVFQGHICIPSDTPVLYKINFATAMLLSNQKDAAFPILNELDEKEHPEVTKIKDSIRKWVKSLTLSEKCRYHVGFYPKKPLQLDFQPGEV